MFLFFYLEMLFMYRKDKFSNKLSGFVTTKALSLHEEIQSVKEKTLHLKENSLFL